LDATNPYQPAHLEPRQRRRSLVVIASAGLGSILALVAGMHTASAQRASGLERPRVSIDIVGCDAASKFGRLSREVGLHICASNGLVRRERAWPRLTRTQVHRGDARRPPDLRFRNQGLALNRYLCLQRDGGQQRESHTAAPHPVGMLHPR